MKVTNFWNWNYILWLFLHLSPAQIVIFSGNKRVEHLASNNLATTMTDVHIVG